VGEPRTLRGRLRYVAIHAEKVLADSGDSACSD
jgi:hypothetical protein